MTESGEAQAANLVDGDGLWNIPEAVLAKPLHGLCLFRLERAVVLQRKLVGNCSGDQGLAAVTQCLHPGRRIGNRPKVVAVAFGCWTVVDADPDS